MKTNNKKLEIKFLKQLKIFEPYIDSFANEDKVCFFENYAGFFIDQEKDVYDKMRSIEKEYNVLVYAATHEFVGDDECWSFLCVPKDKSYEETDLLEETCADNFYAFAYVWNKGCDFFSEFGTILVNSFGGGIQRIG